ncbi:SprB repeat-containing protein, partial [Mariniflexile sp. AS56]
MKIATLRSIFKRFFPAISFSVLMVFSILVFGLNPLPKSHSNISVELYSVEDFLVPEGSIIIDMGVVPQTIKNGLKPYGLVHSLLKYHGTPVLWSINPNKVKDGIDFTVDGKGFKGGPFIVSKDYLTNDVMAVINLWVAKGVVTYKTQSAVSVPLHRELNFGMRWVINNKNSGIAEKYLENAEIPKNDYRSCYASELTSCDDIFVIPHADPDWEDFGNPLLNWNNSIASGGNSGWIWAGCQTGSNLERDVDPKNSNKRTNFLAQNPNSYPGNVDGYGLINHGDHKDASGITPYLNDFHTDPFMQFMGRTDGAHDGGSEQIYMPYPTGNWRSTTKIAAWDPNQEDVLKNKSPGKAALIAFGRAFGDSKRGMVLYEGGHELKNGSEAENVAAQRVFFNFSLEALAEKAPEIVDNTNMVSVLSGGESVQFNIQGITAGSSTATYEWSSTCSSGSFSSKSVRNPIYTAGYVSMAQECVLRLKVTDSCGRVSFKSWVVKIKPSTPEPVVRSCDCSPLYKDSNFSNPKLVSGGALCVDAVYRFSNVFPNNSHGTTIDALVRIEQFNGGASLLEIDVTSTGIPEAFQPRINSTNSSDQSVEFSITFVSGGGNYDDEVELSYFASPFDIDGDGNKTREYADISLPDAYFVSNNTLIDITQTATVVRGEARNTSTAPGGDVSEDPKYTFSSYFEKKSSLRYKIGKKDGDSDRYYSLSMSCANYQNPNSVLITQPVICGTVYDVEGNPLNNVNVNITGSDGSVKNVVTDSSGKYKTVVEIPEAFVDVVYEIRESDLNGYISVSDADGANDNLITRTINLMSSCGNDFIDGVQPEISIDGKTDILCHGTATGVINVSGTGGVEPYQFSANGGTLQSSPMFEGLPAGLYTVELIDSLGNKATANVTLSEPTNPINVVITKENAISSQGCQNGEATASVGGGTAPYTYLWSESAGNQTTETAINLPSGSHTVLITDANNCALEQGVVINCSNTCDAKIKVDKVINILCAGGTTGKTTVSASSTANAGATFTFTWNTLPAQVDAGVTSSTLNGLSAGIYTVSVTIDGTVCQPVEQSVTIVEPASVLNVSATSSDESGPETGDGTASVSATGGTAPYSYSWNPGGETLDTITGLSSGDYTVTVTDANGCTAMATVTVNPGNCKNISAMATATSATCNGQSNGTVTASVTGGSGSFTYSWSPGGATSKSITGLPAGSYTVTVTDSVTQCTVNATANVNEPSVLSSGIAISNIMCFGDSNGSLDLTVSGGTSPYQFLWNNGATTEDLNNLPAGSYSVDITDANGCTTSKTATVNQPSSGLIVSILSQDNTICNASSGSLRVEASGGTIPYSFSLNGVSQAAGEFTNLEAGDYILNVIDANGCEITQDISILVNCTDAENDINTTYVDTPVSGNVLTNDT